MTGRGRLHGRAKALRAIAADKKKNKKKDKLKNHNNNEISEDGFLMIIHYKIKDENHTNRDY